MDYIITKCSTWKSIWPPSGFLAAILRSLMKKKLDCLLLGAGGRGQLSWAASEDVCCPVFELHDFSKHGIKEELTVHGLWHHNLWVGLFGGPWSMNRERVSEGNIVLTGNFKFTLQNCFHTNWMTKKVYPSYEELMLFYWLMYSKLCQRNFTKTREKHSNLILFPVSCSLRYEWRTTRIDYEFTISYSLL